MLLMDKPNTTYPNCFGSLDKVFPMGENGLRNTPPGCMICVFKTECLREAMQAVSGIPVHEEMVDRAYESGLIGFFHRWSKKKQLHQRRQQANRKTVRGEVS